MKTFKRINVEILLCDLSGDVIAVARGKLDRKRKTKDSGKNQKRRSRSIYLCSDCPLRTDRKDFFEEHVKIHERSTVGPGQSSCPHCKGVMNRRNLLSHLVVHELDYKGSFRGKCHPRLKPE